MKSLSNLRFRRLKEMAGDGDRGSTLSWRQRKSGVKENEKIWKTPALIITSTAIYK